ncbi:MAG TPA: hypothetical protein VFC63_20175 [Blastocatellia bacterium]|nr:hypothetical protein [Blastocatellia bacterium]
MKRGKQRSLAKEILRQLAILALIVVGIVGSSLPVALLYQSAEAQTVNKNADSVVTASDSQRSLDSTNTTNETATTNVNENVAYKAEAAGSAKMVKNAVRRN